MSGWVGERGDITKLKNSSGPKQSRTSKPGNTIWRRVSSCPAQEPGHSVITRPITGPLAPCLLWGDVDWGQHVSENILKGWIQGGGDTIACNCCGVWRRGRMCLYLYYI